MAQVPSFVWMAPFLIIMLAGSFGGLVYYQYVFLPASLEVEEVSSEILNPPLNVTIVENKNGWRPNTVDPFLPSRVTLVLGVNNTVIWQHVDDTLEGVIHTATDDNGVFDSGNMALGDEFSYTYTKTGVFNFFCRPHSGWMRGTVEVISNPVVSE